MRIGKSVVGVFLCMLVYLIRGRQGIPFYSAIALLQCIQTDTGNTRKTAARRFAGTAIGALYGLLFILLKLYLWDFGSGIAYYLILSLMLIPVLYTAVLLEKKDAAYFSCVVYLSVVVNHLTDENPFLFVFHRGMDTVIGIVLALLVNSAHLPYRKRRDTLFAVSLDQAVQTSGRGLNAYSRFAVNALLDEGMRLALMTERTPASFLEAFGDLRLRLPVIVMDGAALYDIRENSFRKSYVISAAHAGVLEKLFKEREVHVFVNVILEDLLLIYYGNLQNEAERTIYERLRKSPYRNYLHKSRPEGHPVVYFMTVDKTEKIRALHEELCRHELSAHLKMRVRPAEDFAGYAYLRIYNHNASVGNMLEYLQKETDAAETVVVGEEAAGRAEKDAARQAERNVVKGVVKEDEKDVVGKAEKDFKREAREKENTRLPADPNRLVRKLRRLYLYGGERKKS